MSVQYLSNDKGKVTAVQLPIEEWEVLVSKYPEIDNIVVNLPQWHKQLIDSRLAEAKKNPGSIRPISELMDELDK